MARPKTSAVRECCSGWRKRFNPTPSSRLTSCCPRKLQDCPPPKSPAMAKLFEPWSLTNPLWARLLRRGSCGTSSPPGHSSGQDNHPRQPTTLFSRAIGEAARLTCRTSRKPNKEGNGNVRITGVNSSRQVDAFLHGLRQFEN